MADPVYLDDQGNPLSGAPKVYLDDSGAAAKVTTTDAAPRTWLDTLADLLPTVGGAAGSVAGGTPGAAIGGAAGAGYRDLVQHGNEIPGAVKDVLRNLTTQPVATAEGFAQGVGQGLKDVGVTGAIQGAANVVGNVAGAAASKVVGAVAPKLGIRMMQSAAKPNPSLLKEYGTSGEQIAKTLLDEGVNVTQPGLDKLHTLFTANNAEIKQALMDRHDLLDRMGLPQQVIDKNTVAARALTTANKVASQVNPAADLEAVGNTVEQFQNHPVIKGNLTLPDAQAIKVGTYQQIGKKYGEVSSAAIETQKALARGLKEDIAAEVPQIGDLNARDSRLMAAMDAVGHRIAIAGNRDPVGFAWVAHNPTTFLAALIDRQPAVKSMLARGLYNAAGATAKVSPALIRTAVAAIAQTGSPVPDASPRQP